ncbi:hypothetical protein AB0L00_10860 [Actinoallomurus sp. NPDC052308]|uniref:WXG100 family type VII secretion target n=1 Tax=Actinoallomurus sp. NPDC052308 TaxID=3155530 RepID=UPI003434F8FD
MMTELRVTPDDLESYGKLVNRVGDQGVRADKYLSRYSDLGSADGLLIKIINPASHSAIYSAHQVLENLQKAGWRSYHGLQGAAVYYRKTEHKTAAKVDATYPKAARPGSHLTDLGSAPVQTHHFEDQEDPLTYLKEPDVGEVEASAGPMDDVTSLFEAVAPSTTVVEFVKMVTGHDPAEQAGEWFGGDWKAYAECGGAFENIGAMMNSVSTNIQQGANELRDSWQGNAADAAQGFFSNLSTAVGQQDTVFSTIGAEYKKAAAGVAKLAEDGAGLYKGMIDHAIIGSIALAAAAASSETVLGGAVCGGTAAAEAALIVEDYEKFSKLREIGTGICNGYVGVVHGQVGQMSLFSRFPLPDTGYDSPMESGYAH